MWKLLHPVILGLDFSQDFSVGIDWNNQDQVYLHQDHKALMHSKPYSSKNSTIFSGECKEARLTSKTDILLSSQTIAVVVTKSTLGTKDKIVNSLKIHSCV